MQYVGILKTSFSAVSFLVFDKLHEIMRFEGL